MQKHSVLVDLHPAHISNGFAGIPQDSRLLFAGLSQSSKLDVTGWIYGSDICESSKYMDKLTSQALFLGFILGGKPMQSRYAKQINRLFPASKIAYVYKAMKALLKKRHQGFPLHASIDFAQIWRLFFQSTIPYSEYGTLSKSKYLVSDLTLHRRHFTLNPPSFKSGLYDFVISQDARYVRLSPHTISLVRYHDPMPLIASDTIASPRSVQHHYMGVKKCAQNSTFVCVSPWTVTGLSKIAPEAAESARVIPCILPQMQRQKTDYANFFEICCAHAANAGDNAHSIRNQVAHWFGHGSEKNGKNIPKFIMTLSTIEPRKNHLGLIQAWQKLRRSSGEDIKLLIVGSTGWGYKPIIAAMKPSIASGQLLHLAKVPQHVLTCLFSAARCFAFPSFAEGFGIPPCEAMQCGCPVALSNHPSLKFSGGDGALYFSPYDTDEMANVLSKLVFSERDSPFQKDLIEKGYQNVKRFEQKRVLSQWEELFDDLTLKKKKKISLIS